MTDLISRAALLNDLSYCAPELWQGEEYIKAKIMKQPAVDAAPVVHARWLEWEDGWGDCHYQCSECGCEWCLNDGTPEENGMKFCPNCGAKMDGERRDGA